MSVVFEHASHAKLSQQEWNLDSTQMRLLVFYQARFCQKRNKSLHCTFANFLLQNLGVKKGCQVM